MSRSRILTIARWEFLQKVRSKSFVLSLVLLPVMILAFGFLPSLLVNQGPGETQRIGIIDLTDAYALPLSLELESGKKLDDGSPVWTAIIYADTAASTDSLFAHADADAREEVTEGFLEIRGSEADPEFIWRSPNLTDLHVAEVLDAAVQTVVTERRIKESGVDAAEYARLTTPVEIDERKLTDEGEDKADAGEEFLTKFFSAFVGIILFMILIMTTGQSLVRGLVEEKSNRIMEILVGSATPAELMWGKLIGLSGLGLTQVFAWGVLGGAGLLFISSSGTVSADALTGVLSTLPLVLLYLVLGYVLFAAIFVGAGSLVTTEQEAQFVTQYLTMILVAPLAFAIVVIQDPNAGYLEALSYIPFLTPTLMMLRIVVQMPSVWTIIGTTLVLIVSTIAVTWAAAKIFRTAILLYGKRPSVREVVRWLRVRE